MNNQTILETVQRYVEAYPSESAYVAQLVEQLKGADDVSSRKNFAGHVTASALLVNEKDECLHIHHKALNKMLLPGGHAEPYDTKPHDTATRELVEETRINEQAIKPVAAFIDTPIDIDHHGIPENKKKGEGAHEHWDMLYLFRINSASCGINLDTTEVTGFAWQPVRTLKSKIQERIRFVIH